MNGSMKIHAEDLSLGGQAVIEGVMMRSPTSIATAVRRADDSIEVTCKPYIPISKRKKILNIPVLRGAISFFEMLIIGVRALNYSANVAMEDVEREEREKKGKDAHEEPGKWAKIRDGLMLGGSLVLAFAAAIGVFFALPLFLTEVLGLSKNALTFNIIAGFFRVSLFLAYLWGISKWGEIKRVFEYHGAEHKSIHAYESGEELIVGNVKKYSPHHPRCGTSFLMIVVVLAILLFAVADTIVELSIGHRPTFPQRFLTHFSLLPLLGGISYELLKLSGKKAHLKWIQWLSAPGLWLQNITTKEPDEAQMEVAIAALKNALGEDRQTAEDAEALSNHQVEEALS